VGQVLAHDGVGYPLFLKFPGDIIAAI
jgi:hypothetical protein